MLRSMPGPVLIRKPILGFGPAGWAALGAATVLAVCLFTGYDLRFQIMRLINASLGPTAMYWFYTFFLTPHSFELIGRWPHPALFGLITMSLLLIAMRLHPRRFGPGPYIAAVAGGVLLPCAPFVLVRVMKWAGLDTGEYMPDAPDVLVREAIRMAITVLLLTYITRSVAVTLTIASFHVTWIVGMQDFGVSMNPASTRSRWAPGAADIMLSPWFAWTWHAVTAAVILGWAIRARRGIPKPGHCLICWYNLNGIAGPCPECGGAETAAGSST